MKNKKEITLKNVSNKFNNNRKDNRAITLIALIITVIILLILAGISIAILTGKNGLFARAKQAKENTTVSQVEENITLESYKTGIDEIVNGKESNNGNSGISDSQIIKEINIDATVSKRSIKLSISPILISGFTVDDIATYICIFNGEVKEVNKGETITVSKLETSTKYSIYVIAVDKYAGMIKSNSIEKTTEAANIIPLEYPIITKSGIVNIKLDYGDTSEYALDLNYDCTATDALDKAAYDGDETTFVDVTTGKTKFYFGDDIDIYQVCFKIDSNYSGILYNALEKRRKY